MAITPNSIKYVVGATQVTAVRGVHRYSIRQTQGVEAYFFGLPIHSSDEAAVQALITAAKASGEAIIGTLQIVTSDHTSGGGSFSLNWAGWVLMEVVPDKELDNIRILKLADSRELLRYGKITKRYNVKLEDGTVDQWSLYGTVTPWTVGQYLQDLILESDPRAAGDPLLWTRWGGSAHLNDLTILNEPIPYNLGNTLTGSGGWIGASVQEAAEPVLKAFGLQLIHGTDGLVYVTDEQKLRTDIVALTDGQTGSGVRTSDFSPARPKNLHCIFEAVREVAMETPDATTPLNKGFVLENVLRLPADLTAPIFNYSWQKLEDFASDSIWDNKTVPAQFRSSPEAYLSAHMLKPIPFPLPRDARGVPLGGALWVEYLTNETWANWRQAFRAERYNSVISGIWANLRLGRLNADGGVDSGGNVYAEYTYKFSKAKEKATYGGKSILARLEWSRSIRLVAGLMASGEQPAPFKTGWIDPVERILRVEPFKTNPYTVESTWIGWLTEPFSYGSYAELAHDAETGLPTQFVKTSGYGRFDEDYRLRVIATGTVMGSGDHAWHKVTAALFAAAGTIDSLTLKIHGVTANFAFSDAQIRSKIPGLADEWATSLLNGSEIADIVARVATEVVASYGRGRMGAYSFGGVQYPSTIWAGGECNEMWIEVGYGTPFAITTNYSIKPGQQTIILGRKKLDGEPVRIAF